MFFLKKAFFAYGYLCVFSSDQRSGLTTIDGFFKDPYYLLRWSDKLDFWGCFWGPKKAKNTKSLRSLKKKMEKYILSHPNPPLLWEISGKSYQQAVEHCSCLLTGICLFSLRPTPRASAPWCAPWSSPTTAPPGSSWTTRPTRRRGTCTGGQPCSSAIRRGWRGRLKCRQNVQKVYYFRKWRRAWNAYKAQKTSLCLTLLEITFFLEKM